MAQITVQVVKNVELQVSGRTVADKIREALVKLGKDAENVAGYQINGQFFLDADHVRFLSQETAGVVDPFSD